MRGLLKMMKEYKDCKDVITQLSASRTAVDRTIRLIRSSNLVECVRAAADAFVKEIIVSLVKSR
ncbi:metal-sensing transcriptional repressor [Terribacillus sp. DMT04]|uniref:metal-sensing transcriptional repressor n=1 Tax=Terribacillus sp. DMT04 TaxID=2850441 RepID=UPI0020B7FDBA|nr:metal-sensing transcriptional repressor [Terribacillus sp. DMT04]